MARKQFSPSIIVREELIEVKIPKNTGTPKTKIQLPDNQNLRNTHIMRIELFHFADFPKSIVTKSTVIPFTLFQSIFLTLQNYDGFNFISQDPAIVYHTNGTVSERHQENFDGQKVSYPKSYIEIADAALISDAEDQVLPMRILYRLFDKAEKKTDEASFKNQS